MMIHSHFMAFPFPLRRGKEWKRLRSGASKPITPRRVATFTTSFSEFGREFADHLALVVQRNGGSVEDIEEEIVKCIFQGNRPSYIIITVFAPFFRYNYCVWFS